MPEDINAEIKIISERLKVISDNIDRNYRENKEYAERLRGEIKADIEELKKNIGDHETRLRSLETSNTNLTARLAMSQIIQTTFTTIASAVAAVIGALVK